MSIQTRKIHTTIQINADLHEAWVESLRQKRAGSVPEDRRMYDDMITNAGNYVYDMEDLTDFLMFRAGFQSSDGATFADWSAE